MSLVGILCCMCSLALSSSSSHLASSGTYKIPARFSPWLLHEIRTEYVPMLVEVR